MGIVYRGIHEGIAKKLLEQYKLKVLVETGTFNGESIIWARNNGFYTVYSVEADRGYYTKAKATFANDGNVFLYHGNSSQALVEILAALTEPALIWLDAHDNGISGDSQPIMGEIAAIAACPVKHIVMVDDARMFGNGRNWPSVAEICDALAKTGRNVAVFEDVFIASYNLWKDG